MFLGFNIGCAFSLTAADFIAFRVLGMFCVYCEKFYTFIYVLPSAGFVGSAPIACGGGTVSDLFSEKDRASAMAVYSLGPLVGPVVGPIAGGFIAETIGFKWIFMVIVGISGIAAALGIPFLRETYHPVIRLRRAQKSADPEKAAAAHPHLIQEHGSHLQRIWLDMSRPFILLTRSYVCFLLSLYMAL